MPTYTALTTLMGEQAALALSDAMERMVPEPTGVGVFEIEDGSGLWEVGGYFLEPPMEATLDLLAMAFADVDEALVLVARQRHAVDGAEAFHGNLARHKTFIEEFAVQGEGLEAVVVAVRDIDDAVL